MLAALLAAFLLTPGAALAGSSKPATVTLTTFSDPGESIAQGKPTFSSASSWVGTDGWGSVIVGAGGYRLEFYAQDRQTLKPGVYVDATEDDMVGPKIAVMPANTGGCNEQVGDFEVKDLTFDANGIPDRVWIVFDQHCYDLRPALFGEVRIGEPARAGAPTVGPSILRWPEGDVGVASTEVPVTVLANGDLSPGAATVDGDAAQDFKVARDECAGHALAAGAQCQVWVRFAPTVVGTRVATLHVAGQDVALQGLAHGGTTRVVVDSDDPAGNRTHHEYTLSNSTIWARSTRSANLDLFVGNPPTSDVQDGFAAPWDRTLAPGHYGGTTGGSATADHAGLSTSWDNTCSNNVAGSFDVTESRFDPVGRVQSFAATLEQHCTNNSAALRGTVQFRDGDTAAPAPWLVPTIYPPPAPPPPPAIAPYPAAAPAARALGVAARARARCAARAASSRTIMGTAYRDRLVGSRRRDRILAGAGDDRVRARAGDDCVDGGAGRDVLDGGAGADVLDGGAGRDRLVGGPGRDVLICGPGRDVAIAGPGDVTRGCERVVHRRGG